MIRNFTPFLLSLITLLLSGCALTPSELQSRGSTATLLSAKNAQSTAICIVEKWENAKVLAAHARANHRPTSSGARITLYINEKLYYMVDVDAIPSGSKITYYETWGTHFGKDAQFSAVESCQ